MIKKILFASTNKNKITRIQTLLSDLPIELISLNDLALNVPEIEETANTCVGVATQKNLGYLEYAPYNMPIITQDDTIVFSGIDDKDNPGVEIKKPVVTAFGEFNDSNALKYYTALATKYGGHINMDFHYGHSVGVKDKTNRKSYKIFSAESVLKSRLVSEARKPETVPGYFLSAIMQIDVGGTWTYHTELNEDQKTAADKDLKESIMGLLRDANIL